MTLYHNLNNFFCILTLSISHSFPTKNLDANCERNYKTAFQEEWGLTIVNLEQTLSVFFIETIISTLISKVQHTFTLNVTPFLTFSRLWIQSSIGSRESTLKYFK